MTLYFWIHSERPEGENMVILCLNFKRWPNRRLIRAGSENASGAGGVIYQSYLIHAHVEIHWIHEIHLRKPKDSLRDCHGIMWALSQLGVSWNSAYHSFQMHNSCIQNVRNVSRDNIRLECERPICINFIPMGFVLHLKQC